eukprot:SAG31_NODE_19527_length_599_cov_1.156000_1_plen_46_part_10
MDLHQRQEQLNGNQPSDMDIITSSNSTSGNGTSDAWESNYSNARFE